VDGINYCVACLAGLAVDSGARAAASGGESSLAGATAALYFVTLCVLLWGFLELMLPGGS
jgi:hypothetical protein